MAVFLSRNKLQEPWNWVLEHKGPDKIEIVAINNEAREICDSISKKLFT